MSEISQKLSLISFSQILVYTIQHIPVAKEQLRPSVSMFSTLLFCGDYTKTIMRLELSKHLWIFISTSSWLIFTNVCFAFGEQYSANNNCLICIKLPKIICIQCKRVHDFHNGGRGAKPGDNSIKTRSQSPQSVAFVYYSMAPSSSGLHNNSSNAI